MAEPIPAIDLFAGPGGLGEGFSSVLSGKERAFRIALSIEMDTAARETLRLRSFFRNFAPGRVPEDYYDFCHGKLTLSELYSKFPAEAVLSDSEAWCAELGNEKWPPEEVDKSIKTALGGREDWILIGGPPCQAYSLVGRSRRSRLMKESPKEFEKDHRHYLYKQYLRIIAKHKPPVFVMENVKGLLSTRIRGGLIVEQIFQDLKAPLTALSEQGQLNYLLFPFVSNEKTGLFESTPTPQDFIIRAEDYGIPQMRHRLILLGIRSDIDVEPEQLKKSPDKITLEQVLSDLPALRSEASKRKRHTETWHTSISAFRLSCAMMNLKDELRSTIDKVCNELDPTLSVGSQFSAYAPGRPSEFVRQYLRDVRLEGVRNHESRTHMPSDIQRYFFASCFAMTFKRSPVLQDFPKRLLPDHENVKKGLKDVVFGDRFRVQVLDKPATTVTSHISKDGHYFIHPDPHQCRSLTVREAARIQTFPDNYVFLGNRTEQYKQVGNAVPPLLARKIAEITLKLFKQRDT